MTEISEMDTDNLLRRAGARFKPGARVLYRPVCTDKTTPATVRAVLAYITVCAAGMGQRSADTRVEYRLWLDTGEHIVALDTEVLSCAAETVRPLPEDIRDITLTLFSGNLLSDPDGVDLEASARALASMIESALAAEYTSAEIDVRIEHATGVRPPTLVNGDPHHEAHWDIDDLVQNCWATLDWIVPAHDE